MRRTLIRLTHRAKSAVDYIIYLIAYGAIWLIEALPLDRASAMGGAVLRTLGPLLPAHRYAAENIRHAFPDLPDAERAKILHESWDNLGRMSAEFMHMQSIAAEQPERGADGSLAPSRIEISPDVVDAFQVMLEDGKPALVFSAHLANWELPAILAKRYGMEAAALYRTPNNRYLARRIRRTRRALMGRLISAGRTAPMELVSALRAGSHVGMLVDQRFGRGPEITFFGRPARTNPLFGMLARNIDCPVYGVRAVRTEGAHFRIELVGPLELPRDGEGLIDINAAMATITGIVESWIRATPGPWLWMHRRWRL